MKKLSSKTKQLLSIIVVVFLTITLALFVWAVATQRLDLRKRASSGEPGSIPSPINWTTSDVSITADDFYITSNNKIYRGDASEVTVIPGVVDTNPTDPHWTNIEIRSTENGDDLRIKIYFVAEGSTWHVDSVGILNSNYSDQWVSYDGPFIYTALGHSHSQGGYSFGLVDSNGQTILVVNYTNLKIQAFTGSTPPPTVCPNVPFTLNVTPAIQTGSLGQILRYDVSVTNNDSTCGPLGTSLVVDKPSNWVANFGTQNFTLVYNQTYQTHLDVTSPTANYYIGDQPITVRVVTVNVGNSNSKTVVYNLNLPSSPSPTPITVYKVGDVNNDNKVNLIDIGIVVNYYDSTNPANPRADVNGSGKVDLIDIGLIIDKYEW